MTVMGLSFISASGGGVGWGYTLYIFELQAQFPESWGKNILDFLFLFVFIIPTELTRI